MIKGKQRKLKENEGITIVALVVTIIILLILAGVAINMTLGDNGLFKKSKEAINAWKSAEENETSSLDYLAREWSNLIGENMGNSSTSQGSGTLGTTIKELENRITALEEEKENLSRELENRITTLEEEKKNLSSELEIYKNKASNKIQVLTYFFANGYSAGKTYTFKKDYKSAVALVAAANQNGGGNGTISLHLAKGTYQTYYNGSRVSNGSYSQNIGMILCDNVKTGDTVTIAHDFSAFYAIFAVE